MSNTRWLMVPTLKTDESQ